MSRICFKNHKGRRILFIDASNCTITQALQLIKECKAVISDEKPNSLRILTDISNARFNKEVVDELRELLKYNTPYVFKSAVFGLNKLQKVMYTLLIKDISRHIVAFNDRESAQEWLVDRRQHPRIDEELTIEYTVGIEREKGMGITKNISLGGVSFILNKIIPLNSSIDMLIHLPKRETPLEISGKVVWNSDVLSDQKQVTTDSVGVIFQEMSEVTKKVLFEYIFKRYQQLDNK